MTVVRQLNGWSLAAASCGLFLASACGSTGDAQVLYDPWVADPGPRQPAFLAFSSQYDGVGPAPIGLPNFPKLLSQTGAFADAAELVPVSGVIPYEIQSPLWSDGAFKRRWVSLPEGQVFGYTETEHFDVPPGTVFVKHFEMALDERAPQQRRRLETRFWVAVRPGAQYGVSYKWNEDQTDAELLVTAETELLNITGADGNVRSQPYFFPGPGDCYSCHNDRAGFVLGARAAQLNRTTAYTADRPGTNQLAAWSEWGMLDTRLDTSATIRGPHLTAYTDATQPIEDRVRSYWDGNCSMCHAGGDGSIPGWDARFTTPFEEQGLDHAPSNTSSGASSLISPGAPEDSLIYLRGDTTDPGLRMPPVGRNRIDQAYVDLLGEWIASLAP
jgi:uncharacterized repeat protein (TIGR03806 family)